MTFAKADAHPREDPAAGGGGVDPISERFRRRPSSPDAGDELGFKAKVSGSMVLRRRQGGERRKRKTRKSTDKNGAAK